MRISVGIVIAIGVIGILVYRSGTVQKFDCTVEFKPDVTLIQGTWNSTIPCPDHSHCLASGWSCEGDIVPNQPTLCHCYRVDDSVHVQSRFWSSPAVYFIAIFHIIVVALACLVIDCTDVVGTFRRAEKLRKEYEKYYQVK